MKKVMAGLVLLVLSGLAVYYFYKPARQLINIYTGHYSIYLQPFSDLASGEANEVYIKMKKVVPSLKMAEPVQLPSTAWYKMRNRYRADSIINWLRARSGDTALYIGITSKDISATKGTVLDWGVMGLGFRPGFGCVVSTFRLRKENLNDQLYKLCLHELGHNVGLPHCPHKNCFMRDAEGQNHLDEETSFCADCAAVLHRRGLYL